MNHIRQARGEDAERIAEIVVFNYRLNFYPIFRDDGFYFEELRISNQIPRYASESESIWVYDDGVVKGFIQIGGKEVKKLFVEPVLQGNSIGTKLLEYAISQKGVDHLWALEKNTRAITFYQRHGFRLTGGKKFEEDTTEYLVLLER